MRETVWSKSPPGVLIGSGPTPKVSTSRQCSILEEVNDRAEAEAIAHKGERLEGGSPPDPRGTQYPTSFTRPKSKPTTCRAYNPVRVSSAVRVATASVGSLRHAGRPLRRGTKSAGQLMGDPMISPSEGLASPYRVDIPWCRKESSRCRSIATQPFYDAPAVGAPVPRR